jgi:uncharacterized membrane protein YjjP (DUF1212 family)
MAIPTEREPMLPSQPAHATQQVLAVKFVTELGHALIVAGGPVSSTERTLRQVALGYGMLDLEIGVLSTLVLVRAEDRGMPIMDLAGAEAGEGLRLDQVSTLYDVVNEARLGQLPAAEGLARLAEVWAAPARFNSAVRILGHIIRSVGLGLIITPRPTALLYCAGLGLLVGVLTQVGRRWKHVDVLLPVISSLVVSVIVFLAADAGQIFAPLLLLMPPLITFLPGGALTTAMVELADRHPIAGATRLVAGATQVMLLVFGIVAAQTLVGIPPAIAFAQRSDNLLGWWAPWLGPLVFAVGIYYHLVGPRWSLPWLCLILYVAALGEQIGNDVFGGYFGGFVGALIMSTTAFALDRVPAAPPFLVLFLPAFWLLVPGALAVVGVTNLVGNEATSALLDIGKATFTFVSIALGVLVGVAVARLLRFGVDG